MSGLTLHDLCGASRAELGAKIASGYAIDPEQLAGYEYEGVSLGLGRVIERLSWKKFFKVFERDTRGRVHGWNMRAIDDGLERPWRARMKDGRPVTFGPFVVGDLPARMPVTMRAGVMLDYGPVARAYDPMRFLRDPLVAVNQGSMELLLGWSYLEVAGRVVGTLSYFALRKGRKNG